MGDVKFAEDEDNCDDHPPSEHAQSFQAYLKFPQPLDVSNPKTYSDDEEGESLCLLVSNLQRIKGEVTCQVELRAKADNETVIASKQVNIGHVLITRLFSN